MDRRKLLKLLSSTATATLGYGATYLSPILIPFPRDRALGTTGQKVLFLYLAGGPRQSELFSPQRHATKTVKDKTYQSHLGRQSDYFGSQRITNYQEKEGTWPWAKDSHIGEGDQYTPPILVVPEKEIKELGPCLGGLYPFANKMTIIEGISQSSSHDAGTQLAWTGHTFDPAFPRATIDCLVAAKLGGSLLLPHLLWGRGVASHPQEVPIFQLARKKTAQEYGDQFAQKIDTPLATFSSDYLGDEAAQKIASFWSEQEGLAYDRLTNQANRQFMDTFQSLRKARDQLYQSSIKDDLFQGVQAFASQTDVALQQVTGQPLPKRIQDLSATLGMVSTAFNLGLSSVASLSVANWDDHYGYYEDNYAPWQYRCLFYALGEWLASVDLATTTVVVFSDLSRPVIINERGGFDHNSFNTWTIIGGPFGQGKRFGQMDSFLSGAKVDPKTGAPDPTGKDAIVIKPVDVLAFLLEGFGYTAGREIEGFLGIPQAPAFLRQLLA